MSSYRATVHREGDWWVIDVDSVGATQAKRLDKVDHMARDLIASMRNIPIDDVTVDVTFDLAPDLAHAVSAAKAAADAAKAAQKRASELAQDAVARLQREHWSMRDIARLTGVSFQRVHQVLNEAIAAGRAATQKPRIDAQFPDSTMGAEVGVGLHATQGDAVAAARRRVSGAKRTAAKDRAGV